jgi:membrane protein implicated in regulation of membrane protease activity
MTLAAPPLPIALDQSLRRELTAGEHLLWSAQPSASRLKAGFAIWAFAVPWTVFSLFWEAMALLPWAAETHTPEGMRLTFGIIMPIFGLPFVMVGFWMLWTPVAAMRKAKSTAYALTNRRLFRLVEKRKRETASVLLDQIGPMDRSEMADGWGSLRIQTHSRLDSDGDRITERFEVMGVPGVARLERLILENRASPQF